MRRLLAPLPAVYSLAQLRAAAVVRFPSLIDFNTVDVSGALNAAVYLPDGDTTDPTAWQQSVAAHVPTHPTPEETDAAAAANADTLRAQAASAMAGNRTFIALASPTNAQTVAQVTALSRQMDAVIRLVIGQLDATN